MTQVARRYSDLSTWTPAFAGVVPYGKATVSDLFSEQKCQPLLLPLPFGERAGVRGSQAVHHPEQPLTQPSPRRGEGFFPTTTEA
jgi:hypothetical protein